MRLSNHRMWDVIVDEMLIGEEKLDFAEFYIFVKKIRQFKLIFNYKF